MTSEHDSATIEATSLLGTGEVWGARASQFLRTNTDAQRVPIGVVDDSRSGKEDGCECRRSGGIRPFYLKRQECLSEVRAAIVVKKRGNACGAKGGRKVNVQGK